jgi:hypothetical protein
MTHVPSPLRLAALAVAVALALGAPASAARRPAQACAPSAMLAPQALTLGNPTLAVEQNQLFVISLGSNPSTGYHWVIAQARPYQPGFVGATHRSSATAAQQQQAAAQTSQYGQPPQFMTYEQYQANQARQQGQYARPTAGVSGEDILIFKATGPPGELFIQMQYLPPDQQRPDPTYPAVTENFTIEVMPPAGC